MNVQCNPLASESEGKLHHYARMYGQAIYSLTPEQAQQRAVELRAQADGLSTSVERLPLLAEAVHYESISECLSAVRMEKHS